MKFNIDDYEKKCSVCNQPLINLCDMWVHPPFDCISEDGIRIVTKDGVHEQWMEDHGVPDTSEHQLKSELIDEINKRDTIIKKKDKMVSGQTQIATQALKTIKELKARRWYEWLWESIKEIPLRIKRIKT